MEAWPLFESGLRGGLCFLGIPSEHFRSILDSDAVAKALDNTSRVIEKVVSINDADFNTSMGSSVGPVCLIDPVSFSILDAGIVRIAWSNEPDVTDIIEETVKFIVSSLRNIEVVPPSKLVEGWNSAAIVRRDAVVGVPDQERKMELS